MCWAPLAAEGRVALLSAPMTRTRIAVLASGGGTNLQAIVDYLDKLGGRRSGDVVVVASDREDAHALTRARSRGIAVETLATAAKPGRNELSAVLEDYDVQLVALAGYLRRIPD